MLFGKTATPVEWNTDASNTACDFATALNNYSNEFTATCSDDTVHVCTALMGESHNGDTFNLGSGHNGFITVTGTAFSGGDNDSTTYTMHLTQDEQHIYGSSRLGVSKHTGVSSTVEFTSNIQNKVNLDPVVEVISDGVFTDQNSTGAVVATQSTSVFDEQDIALQGAGKIDGFLMREDVGEKRYEFTNHLGNVLLTTSDKRIPVENTGDMTIDLYVADDYSYSDYYPYGMAMVGRNTNLSDYRFGMNGMEMDNEHKGNGNSYSTYFRQYDPRLGRWKSIDPVVHAWQSPYNAFDANPIYIADPSGADGKSLTFNNTSTSGSLVTGVDGPKSTMTSNGMILTWSPEFESWSLKTADVIGDMPSLGKMILTRLQMAMRAAEKITESIKGGVGDKAPPLSVHTSGEMKQGGGIFPTYKDDRDVKVSDGLEMVENIMFAANHMGYEKANWRDVAKKYVKDTKEMKQLNKALGKLKDIQKGYQNGNYVDATTKLVKLHESEAGKLLIRVIEDFADSPEAQNAKPVLDQPSAEEVQKFFDENFRILSTDSVKYWKPNWSGVEKFSVNDTNGLTEKGYRKKGLTLY